MYLRFYSSDFQNSITKFISIELPTKIDEYRYLYLPEFKIAFSLPENFLIGTHSKKRKNINASLHISNCVTQETANSVRSFYFQQFCGYWVEHKEKGDSYKAIPKINSITIISHNDPVELLQFWNQKGFINNEYQRKIKTAINPLFNVQKSLNQVGREGHEALRRVLSPLIDQVIHHFNEIDILQDDHLLEGLSINHCLVTKRDLLFGVLMESIQGDIDKVILKVFRQPLTDCEASLRELRRYYLEEVVVGNIESNGFAYEFVKREERRNLLFDFINQKLTEACGQDEIDLYYVYSVDYLKEKTGYADREFIKSIRKELFKLGEAVNALSIKDGIVTFDPLLGVEQNRDGFFDYL